MKKKLTRWHKAALAALLLVGGSVASACLTSCVSIGVAVVNIPAALEGGYKVHHETYGAGKDNGIDVYVPDDGAATHDAIVFFYGGRWESGKIADFKFVGAALAKQGFVVAIPEYRKYPEVKFPAFVEDGAKAVAWFDDHADDYGARRGFHLAGHSAGAHIAALLTADESYLAAEDKKAHQLVRDFAGLAGPYDFTPEEKDLIDIFGPPARYPQMRVPNFITGHEPPMLLQYGADDTVVGKFNMDNLAKKIREKHGQVKVVTYPGIGHIGIIGAISGLGPKAPVVDDMVAFFKEHPAK